MCFLLVGELFSQESAEYIQYKAKYPNENGVDILKENVIKIGIKKGELAITEEKISLRLFLNQLAKYSSEEKIYTSDFTSLDKVSAASYNYINGKYKKSKVKTFTEKDEMDGSVFYDDLRSVNFDYSGLETGSKIGLEWRKTIKNPRMLGLHLAGNFTPIENFKLQFIVDKNVGIEFKTLNMDSADISFVKTTKGNNNIYEWTAKGIKSYPNESNSRGYKFIIPQIIPIINYYHEGGDTTFILNSEKDLYKWYSSLTENINQGTCDANMVSLVDSLTSNCTTNLEKVRAIYYWTQKNIKYIAFENGLGGFIPRNANEVFKKKYGDCKDNSSILQQMLKQAGLEGHLTWIGTRSLPYKYKNVYSPIVDNHMILTYFENDKPYFLDATGRYQSLNLPSSFIQGKEAMVGIDKDNFKILKVPVVGSEVNTVTDSIALYLEDKLIKGIGHIVYQGYDKINLFYDLERITTRNRTLNYLKDELEIGNNNFLLDSVKEYNKFSYDKEFKMRYQFTLRNYIKEIGGKIYLNLNLNQKDVDAIKESPPFKTDVEYTHKYKGSYCFNFKVPKNYKISNLPKDFNVVNDLCEIKISYKVVGNNIFYYHSIKTKFLVLTIEQQKTMHKILTKVQKNYKEVVVLKHK